MIRMKNLWGILTIMMVALLSVGIVSCSKDDDEKKGGNSSVPSKLVGYWFGGDTGNEGYWLVLNLASNGYGSFKLSKINTSSNYVISDYSSLPWRYNSSKQHIFLYTSDTQGYAFPVVSFGSSTMTVTASISGRDIKFSMEKSGDGSSSSGGSSGGSSSGSSSSSSKCNYCLGSGKCSNYANSAYNKYYCLGSGKCQYCGGDGLINGFGINNVVCPNCWPSDGDGKCSKCKGTGKCSKCNGTGYR